MYPKIILVVVQIIDPTGNSVLDRDFPVDNNGQFDILFVGDPGSGTPPLSEGVYAIKVIGINNNETKTDTNFFILHTKQQPLEQKEKKNEHSDLILISLTIVILFIISLILILKFKQYIINRNNSKNS